MFPVLLIYKKGLENEKTLFSFSSSVFSWSTGRVQRNNTGQLEITTIFQKYMILITIIWICEHSTAIANKNLGALPDARSQSRLFTLFEQKEKEDAGSQAGCARDKKLTSSFLFSFALCGVSLRNNQQHILLVPLNNTCCDIRPRCYMSKTPRIFVSTCPGQGLVM